MNQKMDQSIQYAILLLCCDLRPIMLLQLFIGFHHVQAITSMYNDFIAA